MVAELESDIDRYMDRVELPPKFVIPGGNELSARLDVARAAIRRHVRSKEKVELAALGRKMYDEIVARVLAGAEATPQEALTVLRAPDEDVLDAVAAVARLRRAHYGMTVKVNYLVNLKSGLCPEDCGYCSQALGSTSEILRYTWLKEDQALDQAPAADQQRFEVPQILGEDA